MLQISKFDQGIEERNGMSMRLLDKIGAGSSVPSRSVRNSASKEIPRKIPAIKSLGFMRMTLVKNTKKW